MDCIVYGVTKSRPRLMDLHLLHVCLIYNVVFVSGVQQSDSDMYTSFFQIIFHYRFLQDTEYCPLCYTVNLCCLPVNPIKQPNLKGRVVTGSAG